MHIFVTGASGLIGKAVTKELLGNGHTVLGLARSEKAAKELTALGADVQRGSLHDLDILKEGAAKSDGVIHLGFIHDFANYEPSCQTDRQAIQAMGEVLSGSNRPLIITSGTGLLVHGRVGTEDDPYDSSSPFAARGRSETLAQSLNASMGVRTTIMRLPPVNHGNNDHQFIPILIATAREKGASVYIGDGLNRWPAVHYLDTAVAYRLALERANAGSTTFHVVAEEGIKMKDIAETIGKKLGLPVESKSMEEAQGHFGPFAWNVASDQPVSGKKTQDVLHWKPQQCTLLADLQDGDYFKA